MPEIRTVFQPDRTRQVDEHEAAQLEREGLLLPLEPDQPAAPKPGTTVTAAAMPQKEANPDGSKQGQ